MHQRIFPLIKTSATELFENTTEDSMKKIIFCFAIILAITGCIAPKTQTVPATQPAASETPTPKSTATITPSEAPPPVTPTSTTTLGELPDATLPDGLGVCIHYEFFPETYMPNSEYVLLKEANIGIVRDDMWPGGACEKPPYCFEYFNKLVGMMSEIGVRVVFNLQDYQNQEIGTEAGRKTFAGFASAAAKELKGKGVIWEIWNEPDLDEYWKPYSNPQDYALLVEETAQAIREADPDAVIIGPSVSTLSTVYRDNWRFLNTIGESGTLSKFDAVDVHLYNGGNPESQIENLRKLRRLIDFYSPDKKIPIVSTEWGYSIGGKYYGHWSTPEEQPKYLVRSFLVKNSHEINLSLWYDWKNDDWDPNGEAEHHFGVITSSGETKPAYEALKTLTTTLDGYQFVRRIATRSSHDYLLLFRKGESGVIAAWTITEPHTLAIPNVIGDIEAISMFGEKKILQSDAQELTLQLLDSPQYLLLTDGLFGSENVFWKPAATFFRLDEAGHGEIPIEIENPSDQEQIFELQVSLNDKIVGNSGVTLGPNETKVVSLPLDIKPKSEELDFFVKITVVNNEVLQSAWVWVQR